MLCQDIESTKQKLYAAIDHGDKNIIYNLSVELDILIVKFYRSLMTFQNGSSTPFYK